MKKFEKILGWTLLLIGVLIIIWSLYSSYNIFTAKNTPPEIFKVADEGLTPSQNGDGSDVRVQIDKAIEEQLKKIIPTTLMPKLLNLISWSIFAGILILGGAKISNIGITLMAK